MGGIRSWTIAVFRTWRTIKVPTNRQSLRRLVVEGFNYLVSRFRPAVLSAHIELRKGERSDLAELAANIL